MMIREYRFHNSASAAVRQHRIALAGILLLSAILYFGGLGGPLLFDDYPALSGNVLVQIDGVDFDDWRVAALSSKSGPLGRVLPMLTFGANHALESDFTAVGLKLGNILIHLVSGWFLYLWLNALLNYHFQSDPRLTQTGSTLALLAAGMWILHPLHVSTVLYVVQRMAQMAALFVLFGLWVFVRYRARWASHGATNEELVTASLWLALLTFLAAFSKENGALLPLLALVCEVAIFRGAWSGRSLPWLRFSGIAALALPFLVLAALLLFYPEPLAGKYGGRSFTLWERLLTQSRVLWEYIYWLVLPRTDLMGFQHDDIIVSKEILAPLSTLVSLVSWAGLLIVAVTLRSRMPLLLFGLLFYLTAHSLESSVWPLELVYEHRNYLPSVGVLVIVAAFILRISSSRFNANPNLVVMTMLLILCFPLGARVHTWSDEFILSETNLRNHPDSARGNFFRALALIQRYERQPGGAEDGESSNSNADDLLLARHYYEIMHQKDVTKFASIVTLKNLDDQYFPAMGNYVDWLHLLSEAAAVRVLQAEDYNSLDFLVKCYELNACNSGGKEFLTILEDLSSRYPSSSRIYSMRYRLGQILGLPRDKNYEMLLKARSVNPSDTNLYPLFIEYALEADDIASTYLAVSNWMAADPKRRQLGLIKAAFSDSSVR